MTREPLDSRIEMMIASLYGELSPEDEIRFQEMRNSDPALQREWDEVTSTRSLLAAWEFDEPTPAFEHPTERAPAAWDAISDTDQTDVGARSRREPTDRFGEWRDRLRALLDPSRGLGWAVAVAVTVLLILSWSGLRVETVDGGIAFRMNSSENGTGTDGVGPGSSLPHDVSQVSTNRVPLTGRFASVEDGTSPYLTRNEFDAYTAGMARVMNDLVYSENESTERSQEFNGFMRTLIEGLSLRRDEDYQDLRGRIEAVRYGLGEVESNANDRFELIEVKGQSLTPQANPQGGK